MAPMSYTSENHGQTSGLPAEIRQEIQERISPGVAIAFHFIDQVFTTIWLAIKAGMWISLAYIAYLAIKELAGQQTAARFIFGFFTTEKPDESWPKIWIAASVLFFIWARLERWLRLRKVASMSNRVKELERHFDQNRTSSGLTNTGETPVEERLA